MIGEHPHDAGLLGQRNELVRREQPALRVLPANERLHVGDGAGVEVDERLVVHDELAQIDGVAQLADELQPRARVAVLLVRVEGMSAARRLRLVHRHIGVPQEAVGILAMFREDRDPHARGHLDVDAVDREAVLERARDPVADLRGRSRAGQQHRELVAAETGQDVVGAQDGAQRGPTWASTASPA